MSEVRNQTRRYMDIGRAHRLLKEGKSEAEVYEDFETRYNRHKENPWWGDKAPDVIFSHILEIIKKAEEKKKEMK